MLRPLIMGRIPVTVHGVETIRRSEPSHGKRLQGAVDARRRVHRRTLLYFK